MTKTTLTATACATLLWAGTALATPTAQQQCDATRITAWKTYQACVDAMVARDAKGLGLNNDDTIIRFATFARCRHAYFSKWTGFQNPNRKPSLAGSTCIGSRFTDNGDETVTDNLSALVWEKKANGDMTPNFADPHDADNYYAWSAGAPYTESGPVFTDFLASLSGGAGFAGANGWRLPTFAELQTTLLDFTCSGTGAGLRCHCPSNPCVDPAVDSGNTVSNYYWSATSYLLVAAPGFVGAPNPNSVWVVNFADSFAQADYKGDAWFVRAVRGGL